MLCSRNRFYVLKLGVYLLAVFIISQVLFRPRSFEKGLMNCGVEADKASLIADYIKNNANNEIRNVVKLGPLQPRDNVVVVQVHGTDPLVFFNFTENLRNVDGIEKTLLIFSHLYYNEPINSVIEEIRFAKVLQIFFPFNIQTCEDFFPGHSEYFCTLEPQCRSRGSGRDAYLAQKKHFWWWTINKVFNLPDIHLRNTVLFIEDTDVFTQDLIYMLNTLKKYAHLYCRNCELLDLGAGDLDVYNSSREDAAVKEVYRASPTKSGLALNGLVWRDLRNMGEYFCVFDDYDWRNSLQFISESAPRALLALAVIKPRVMKESTLDLESNEVLRSLFPRRLTFTTNHTDVTHTEGKGYWKDIRDRKLCLLILNMKSYDV
ncbi:hypothetical protein JYU34_004796 [Plutella xylostella]|uniref:Alpha-1,6-mannosyl-glycoprotein 2-beta-N-acetylglucosaminyltransferase n=1 Tax=Plutella xylostella TaxID=51655 RepID=A0ABQ7QYV4_PLUXY|nr:hypothetical protein JYU34_004796 [Plutella xylostella]